MHLEQIRALVEPEFLKVNELIKEYINSSVPRINDISNYITAAGGKRLRPLIALLVCKACNYNGNLHTLLAASLEFIHAATLLHDDVIDNSELRRGKKTANSIWDNQTSILAGDFLYSRAFQMLLQLEDNLIFKILADTTNAITEGEVLQLVEQNNLSITEASYFAIITAKTANLFAAASNCAAVLSKVPPHIINACTSFGLNLGIAYQLIDDALDLNNDLQEGKITLPLIHALQHATPEQIKKIHAKALVQDNIENILEIINLTKSIDYVLKQAEDYIVKAKAAIALLPASKYTEALQYLSEFNLTRNY